MGFDDKLKAELARIAKGGALLRNAGLVEDLLGVEHRLLGGLQHGIHAPDDAHRKDHVRVLPTLEEIAHMSAFIVSPGASFTTGFTFDMTGGRATY